MVFPAGRIAVVVRIAGFLVCSPFQAFAYATMTGSIGYALVLAYIPAAAGFVGLASRPLSDVIANRERPRSELSGKGAIVGMVAVFAALLVFVPHDTDRTKLAAVFFAGALAYYALGKIGCVALGCCRAEAPFETYVSLPVLETVASLALGALALASLYATPRVRLIAFVVIALAFACLRVLSRCVRGASWPVALRQLDALAAFIVALSVALAAIAAE
ncbi:MAG: hypothetical protein JOZ86_04425 [Candidatus Eremiobacteraeota bacterium]|nr:hypothetical protein [Candidatus Eremiobacteraeota bacterium]